ncbi:ABC transporter substrate-binding protein [Serpentinicella sp. ANB-PHB4]|uniref:ABC transporter substrate-binding protein n=1 Tax=Serpentinicella sp. ANB-PHB4 TaxID=3074076 RepID=UPI0028553A20|nr:ABC transporter substrate-binding protein [Serpentinicella sp. ANB-PHB4]MDR5658988.1 ABC transporter substrate-binding protein [Serpentinicella sp. ANB-PHB4]
MNKKLSIIFLVAIMIFMVGCSGQTNTLEAINEKGTLTFAMTGAYPPFNFINDDGDLVGFDIDIANAIAEKMGVEADPMTVQWDGIITGLTSGRFDMIIGSMAITEERLEQVNFSDPYYYDGAQFFGHKDIDANDITDIEDAVVGVVTGTTFLDYLEENVDNVKDIMQFDSDVDNMRAVERGQADGLVTGLLVGLNGIDSYDMPLEAVGDPLYVEEIGIAIRKDDTDLVDAVNSALQEIIEDGTYAQLSEKWFGVNILEN